MNIYIYIYIYINGHNSHAIECYSAQKEWGTDTGYKVDGTGGRDAEFKKPDTNGYCTIPYEMKYPEPANP